MENDVPQTVPSRFLQRIAHYPEPVQQALNAEITDASLTRYLRVLHGADPDPAALPSAGGVSVMADAMLSRLIGSKRFLARVQQFLQLLQPEDPAGTAAFGVFLHEMILPLAEPDTPYTYKIDEVLAADPPEATVEALSALKDIIALCQKLGPEAMSGRRVNGDWLAQLTLQAGASGDVMLLNATLAALGQPLRLQGSASPAALPSGQRFLQKLLWNAASLSTLDTDSMYRIARSGLDRLTAPRPLTLVLAGGQRPEDAGYWNRLLELGLVAAILPEGADVVAAGGVLQLPAGARMSPVTLGWLSCVALPGNSLAIAAERQTITGSWAREITGYIGDDGTSVETVGLYRATADAPAQAGTQLLLAQIAAVGASEMFVAGTNLADPADCHAIVLRLGAAQSLGGYANIENCLAYDSLADLTQALADAPARLRKKPVVVIGPGSSAAADYIVSSAIKFRALGAAYLTTPLSLDYNGETGKLTLSLPEQDHLTAFALAEASVLPLGMILDHPQEIATQLQMGVFTVTRGFAVCYARPEGQEDPDLQRQQRRLDSRMLTAAERERLFMVNPPDFSYLQSRDSISHWPIETLISTIRRKHQQLQSRLSSFLSAPRPGPASQILRHLSPQSKEALSLAPQIDAFLLKLSETPAVLLELPPEHVLGFLDLCRHTASADQLAANLSVYAQGICNRDVGLIVPLFEFLACSLAPEDLRMTLAFTAEVRPKNRRYMFRIAECIRRYGDEALMVQYLARVKNQDPDALKDTTFTRCFQQVLSSQRMAALLALLGADTLRSIAGTVSFAESFRQAVLAQNKAGMQRLVADPIPDFLKWMDGLRALSNELRALASDSEAFPIPGISGLYRRKLAAITFADSVTLRGFAREGFLDSATDLDVIGQYLLGNTAPLAEFIARAFEGTGAPAFEIAGDSTAAVFANAQTTLAERAAPGSASHPDAPLVSVIMSAFNPDIELMRLSIVSILAQTHAAVEIFVVDDASEAESSQAIQAMLATFAAADRARIDYSRLEVNSGPYVGRNLALRRARGAFIAIQDADDWSHPQRFEAQLAAFAATPELRLVTSPHVRIDRFGAVQMEAGFTVFGDGPMTSMFRRDLFDEIGGFANIRSRGDVEMRERIRSYYGGHVLQELQMPCMLCFADSATLSQKTKTESAEYLQIFRTNISRKRSFAALRRDGEKLLPEHSLVVPMPLRPPVVPPVTFSVGEP